MITVHGTAANPATDNAVGPTDPATLTMVPPASMIAGQLCFMIGHLNGSPGSPFTLAFAGGQTWTDLGQMGPTGGITAHAWFCRFNGTWTADPGVNIPNVVGTTVPVGAQLLVFTETPVGTLWFIDQALQVAGFAAPSGPPFNVTRAGQTASAPKTVTLAGWISPDNNTWGNISGAGWSVAGNAQYRNSASVGCSATYAYFAQDSPGTTGSVTKEQTGLGPDQGLSFVITFGLAGAQSGTVTDGIVLGDSASVLAAALGLVADGLLLGDLADAVGVVAASDWKVRQGGLWLPASMKHRAGGIFSPTPTTFY